MVSTDKCRNEDKFIFRSVEEEFYNTEKEGVDCVEAHDGLRAVSKFATKHLFCGHFALNYIEFILISVPSERSLVELEVQCKKFRGKT